MQHVSSVAKLLDKWENLQAATRDEERLRPQFNACFRRELEAAEEDEYFDDVNDENYEDMNLEEDKMFDSLLNKKRTAESLETILSKQEKEKIRVMSDDEDDFSLENDDDLGE